MSFITLTLLTRDVSVFTYIAHCWPYALVYAKIPWSVMSKIYPLNTFRTKPSIFIMFASNIKDNLENLIGEGKTIEFTLFLPIMFLFLSSYSKVPLKKLFPFFLENLPLSTLLW